MTVEEALKLIGVDSSEIIRNNSEEYKDFVLFGSYKGEPIDVSDEDAVFVISLGLGRKNFRVHKIKETVEEFQIVVA
ncbi:MAG: hypothetical protein K5751_12620 [Treponemataceae bacterium]|nr:hypothetical protein [Treponemataceae bacterium]